MKKILLTALLGASTLAFSAGAYAEGDAAIRSNSSVNTDASMSSQDSGNSSAANAGAEGSTMNGENVSVRTFDIDSSSDAQAIIAAQQGLNDAGYRVAVDGIWGPQTERALNQYTASNQTGTMSGSSSSNNSSMDSGAGEGMSMGNSSSVSNSRANNSTDNAGDSGTGGY